MEEKEFYDQNILDITGWNKIKHISPSLDIAVPQIYQWALCISKTAAVEHSISHIHLITESVFQESHNATFTKADLALSETKQQQKKMLFSVSRPSSKWVMNWAPADSEVDFVLIPSKWLFPGLPMGNVRNNYTTLLLRVVTYCF